MKKLLILLFAGMLAWACNPVEPQEESLDKAALTGEVTEVIKGYTEAWNADAPTLLSYYMDNEDFFILTDGEFYDYDSWAEKVEQMYEEGITYNEEPYKDIEIRVLGKESAFFSCRLDYISYDSAMVETYVGGTVNYILVHDGETWKIIHGHACHKLVEEAEGEE